MTESDNNKFLRVRTNYMIEELPFFSLRYIMTEDKVTKVCTKRQKLILTYMTLSELSSQLPKDQFLQISRNCIVAMSAISDVENGFVKLYSGETLQFSQRRKVEIQKIYRNYVNKCGSENDARPPRMTEFAEKFACFDKFPIAFTVVEMITDSNGVTGDFVFRYVNEEMAKLEGRSIDELIDRSFYDVFKEGDMKWREIYSETALNGTVQEFISYSSEVDKHLKIQCYQPFYGFCACMLSDVSKAVCLIDFKKELDEVAKLLKENKVLQAKKTIRKMQKQY